MSFKKVLPAGALAAAAILLFSGCTNPGLEQTVPDGQPNPETSSDVSYPEKPVTFIVPYAPGGPADLNSRAITSCLSAELGQPFVVENRDGGGGAIGTGLLKDENPDGYTIGLGTNGTIVANPLANSLGYGPSDFTAVSAMTKVPSMIAVGKNSPFKSGEAFFAELKANPESITIGVPGATSSMGMELRRLAEEYGVHAIAVPTAGSAEMTSELLGGHLDAIFINDDPTVASQVETGDFVPLAVSSDVRLDLFPEVPTIAELGFPDLVDGVTIQGIFAPKGVDQAIVSVLEEGIETCLTTSVVQDQIGERFIQFQDSSGLEKAYQRLWDLYEPLLQG